MVKSKKRNQRKTRKATGSTEELAFAIKDYFSSGKSDVKENEKRISLKSQVKQLVDREFVSDESLKSVLLEIEPEYLPYIDSIFEDQLINHNYIVEQLDETIIRVTIKELQL